MTMKKNAYYISVVLLGSGLIGCKSSSSDDNSRPNTPESSPVLAFKHLELASSMSQALSSEYSNNNELLIGFDEHGLEYELTNVEVVDYKNVSLGLYIAVNTKHRALITETEIDQDGNLIEVEKTIEVDRFQRYFVEHSGEYHMINDINEYASYVGESASGRLIFSYQAKGEGIKFYDLHAKVTERVRTSIDPQDLMLEKLTGDFLLLHNWGNGTKQIMHIENGLRTNTTAYPNLASIDDEVVLFANSRTGYDFSNGAISEFEAPFSFHPNITEKLAALEGNTIVLATGVPDCGVNPAMLSEHCLYSVSTAGDFTRLSESTFSVAYTHGNHESQNTVLFGDDNYLVVKGINDLQVYDRQSSTTDIILDDLNMIDVTFARGVVYFKAEDDFGNPINGRYSIHDDRLVYFSKENNLNKIEPTGL